MRNSLLITIFILSLAGKAQPPSRFYTKFGGTGVDIGYGVKQTSDKGYIVAGSTTSYGAGASDVYLVKLDSMGKVKWMKTFGGFGNEVGRSVLQLSDTGYVITGFTNSYGSGGYDVYTIRTDKTGVLIWQKTFGGIDWDFGYDLVQSSDGNLIVCGSTTSFGYGGKDGLLLKYDTDGNLIWQKYYGGEGDDEFKAMITKNASVFYAAGVTQSYSDPAGDMYCLKVDNNGDSLMTIIHGGNLFDGANDVVINKNDTIVLIGGSESFTSGGRDAFYASFKSNGTFVSQRFHGLAQYDEEFYTGAKSLTSNLEEVVAVHTTEELSTYKKDIKTIFLNESGDWWGGFGSGAFGFSKDEEIFDMNGTSDKGYVQIGYTESFNALDKDVFLIKRDSALDYGTQVVTIKENQNIIAGGIVYPNPLSQNETLVVASPDEIKSIEVVDLYGRKISFTILSKTDNKIELRSNSVPGVYFLSVIGEQRVETVKILLR